MPIATHLIKIRCHIDTEKWTEETLKEYVKKKIINEIDPSFHTSLELFSIKDDDAKIWVYISALPSEVKEDIVKEWLDNNVKEDNITVKEFEIVDTTNMLDADGEKFFVYLQ